MTWQLKNVIIYEQVLWSSFKLMRTDLRSKLVKSEQTISLKFLVRKCTPIRQIMERCIWFRWIPNKFLTNMVYNLKLKMSVSTKKHIKDRFLKANKLSRFPVSILATNTLWGSIILYIGSKWKFYITYIIIIIPFSSNNILAKFVRNWMKNLSNCKGLQNLLLKMILGLIFYEFHESFHIILYSET